MPPCRYLWCAAAILLSCGPTQAADTAVCPAPPPPSASSAPDLSISDKDAPVELRAREVRTIEGGVTELEGDVELSRGGERIDADHLRYNHATRTLSGDGRTEYQNAPGDRIETERFELQVDTRTGETGPSRYTLRNDVARGDAARIEFLGPDHTRFTDLRYTTCREGRNDWFLKIGELTLDNEEEIGTVWHATLDIYGMPVLYFPYINFSIADKRKSGFLFPSVGHSDQRGYEIAAPYYFNLAPNYDATLTPRVLTKRGLQLESEFRYLTPDSNGTLNVDALPNDREADEDRLLGALNHRHTFSAYWSGNADLRYVSDSEYFADLGDRLSLTTQSHLLRTADVTYRGNAWTFAARGLDHQTIDLSIPETDRPYARLPQLQLLSAQQSVPNQPYPQLEAEWNRFQHDVNLEGERLNINTGVSLPLQNSWGFFTPKLGGRYIGYQIERNYEQSPGLARGVFSLDSGLIFERDTDWGGNAAVHTLEPRLFYLRIPSKNQDALPNFDSAVPDLSFDALFRENRFSGGDRIGDANQLTAAITTRFLDLDQGIERLRLSLGRIYYFDDLEVNLPPGVQTAGTSDVVAEASAWLLGNWHARDTIQWDTGSHRVERNNFYLQYQPAQKKILSLGQVFTRDQLGQLDLGFEWPLFGPWTVRARSLHSTREDRNIESYAGIEYNACCWALRITAARRWQDPDQVNSISAELQLNGLSKFGRAPESPLKQGLFFPYEDESQNRLLSP